MIGESIEFNQPGPWDVIARDMDFPQYIFKKKFSRYLFFDSDMRSSGELVSALQNIAESFFNQNLKVDIFSSTDGEDLAHLNFGIDWVAEIDKVNKSLSSVRDSNGLILLDMTRTWMAYQKRPVDIGVLAFDTVKNQIDMGSSVKNCFFDCEEISGWLAGRSARDFDLVNSFGRNFLLNLVTNYEG